MRRLALKALAVSAVAAWPVAAQDLLPPRFADWNAVAASSVRAESVEELATDDAAIFRECGLLAAERRVYVRGAETLTVTIYRMRDPTAAYGIYTYLRTEEMPAADLTPYSALARQRALVTVGNLLLEVTGANLPRLTRDLKALAVQLVSRADKGPFPTLVHHLPTRGLIPNSERYLLGPLALGRLLPLADGDWIGFADGAEAQLARYRVNGQEATLLLAAYPTPQAAARKLEDLARRFVLNPERNGSLGPRASIFARRKESLLMLVAYAKSRNLANSLFDQVRYETQVTWNEPKFSLTDPSISQVIIGTVLGTGILLLFALVAGISFGGVRLVVKLFFPGKVFDRAAHIEILQLGLSSKPIEAKDFY